MVALGDASQAVRSEGEEMLCQKLAQQRQRRLVAFCRRTLCHVNLITLNEVAGSPFQPSDKERVALFAKTLSAAGVETTIRESRGSDIDAACGQLKQKA